MKTFWKLVNHIKCFTHRNPAHNHSSAQFLFHTPIASPLPLFSCISDMGMHIHSMLVEMIWLPVGKLIPFAMKCIRTYQLLLLDGCIKYVGVRVCLLSIEQFTIHILSNKEYYYYMAFHVCCTCLSSWVSSFLFEDMLEPKQRWKTKCTRTSLSDFRWRRRKDNMMKGREKIVREKETDRNRQKEKEKFK